MFRINRQKSPHGMVKIMKENLIQISKLDSQKEEKKCTKALEEISNYLGQIKANLSLTSINQSNSNKINLTIKSNSSSNQSGSISSTSDRQSELITKLSQEIFSQNLLKYLIENLRKIDFEGRKDVVHIFSNLIRQEVGPGRYPMQDYLLANQDILLSLLMGYENHDIALSCGQMLKESLRHKELLKIVLLCPNFYKLFDYVEVSTFDVASDAFSSFRELLTKHKAVAAEFLENDYDNFFENYKRLLISDNYVTKRQALKLLGEILLDRHNFTPMTRYISNTDNMKLIMNLLKEKSRNIQFEAFHVFKVFVANPNKPASIEEILQRNRDKLIDFLSCFHNDRVQDEQFVDEKAYLIRQIQELKPLIEA